MNSRTTVTDAEVGAAIKMMGDTLQKRILEKGAGSFISHHEILGSILDETAELRDAVHEKRELAVVGELIDVAVGCVFGIASIIANQRAAKAAKP